MRTRLLAAELNSLAIMSVSAETIVCSDCGAALTDARPSDELAQRAPCASCGGTKRTYHVFVIESVPLRDGLAMKAKRPGDKRPYVESKAVPDHSRKLEKLVHLERIVDRDNDRYFERVTDYESGEVIRECDEPLSQHLGHGSDKKITKDDG